MVRTRDAVLGDGSFSEGQLLGLLAVVWLAVMMAVNVPLMLGIVIGGFATIGVRAGPRRQLLVALSVALVATSLGFAAEADYQMATPASLDGIQATLVTDTEPSDFGWRAEARIDVSGQRVRLVGAGFERPDLIAGQPVLLTGRLGPGRATEWEKSRHLVGVVSGAEVVPLGGVAWFRRPGEWLRSGVLDATGSFDDDQAALYHGLVIGDDRFQGEGQRAQFRAAGLSHLLAVSGQNVSFLLAIFAPLTRKARPLVAFMTIVCLLVVFALATRLEPSVLRATVTAGVSTIATMRSARSAGVRSLSLAVIVLLLIDPFLAWSVGFRLSVAASVGILLLAPLIRSRLPWPHWVADPAAITLAAQIGVSPVLLIVFGPVATVTIPANLLAGWAAGAVMTLGLSVGLLASVSPEVVATVLQVPSRCLVWWIGTVATQAAAAPLPAVSLSSLPWIALAGALAWWRRPGQVSRWWWFGPLAVVIAITSGEPTELNGWHERTATTPSVLVIEDPTERWVEALVDQRIRAIDVVIVVDGGWTTARTIEHIREVADVGVVLAPGDHRIVGGRRILEDQSIVVAGGRIDISAQPSELEITVVVGSSPDDR